jgi:DNA-binding transcriptional regulator LsrR (DeoR family)
MFAHRAAICQIERRTAHMSIDRETTGPAELVLTATVARRFYLEGVNKSDIAAELGLSRFKVARMLDWARATGLVRIELDTRGEIDLDLSVRLRAAHGLKHCVVIDAPDDDEALLRNALGRAAAELLSEIVEPGDVLGLAWARSLMAMRTSLSRLPACDVVQLTGALSLPDDDSSIELVRDLARKSNGRGFVYYAPMVVPDAATARALRTQPDIARAIGRYPDVTKAVIGVGAWQHGLSTVVGALTEQERREIYDLGVRGELSGVQIDGAGNPVTTPLTDRLIGIDAEQLHAVPDVIAVAYGTAKVDAVHAGIRGEFITSLVTHTALANGLLERA